MLSWPAGPKKVDGIWAKYWYSNTHKSKGFEKNMTIQNEPLAEEYHDLAQEAKQYYNKLFENALKA